MDLTAFFMCIIATVISIDYCRARPVDDATNNGLKNLGSDNFRKFLFPTAIVKGFKMTLDGTLNIGVKKLVFNIHKGSRYNKLPSPQLHPCDINMGNILVKHTYVYITRIEKTILKVSRLIFELRSTSEDDALCTFILDNNKITISPSYESEVYELEKTVEYKQTVSVTRLPFYLWMDAENNNSPNLLKFSVETNYNDGPSLELSCPVKTFTNIDYFVLKEVEAVNELKFSF